VLAEIVPPPRTSLEPELSVKFLPAVPVIENADVLFEVFNTPPVARVKLPSRLLVVKFFCSVTPTALLTMRLLNDIFALPDMFCADAPL
jgi:hypothetical protein